MSKGRERRASVGDGWCGTASARVSARPGPMRVSSLLLCDSGRDCGLPTRSTVTAARKQAMCDASGVNTTVELQDPPPVLPMFNSDPISGGWRERE
jgi:hypothetical protein